MSLSDTVTAPAPAAAATLDDHDSTSSTEADTDDEGCDDDVDDSEPEGVAARKKRHNRPKQQMKHATKKRKKGDPNSGNAAEVALGDAHEKLEGAAIAVSVEGHGIAQKKKQSPPARDRYTERDEQTLRNKCFYQRSKCRLPQVNNNDDHYNGVQKLIDRLMTGADPVLNAMFEPALIIRNDAEFVEHSRVTQQQSGAVSLVRRWLDPREKHIREVASRTCTARWDLHGPRNIIVNGELQLVATDTLDVRPFSPLPAPSSSFSPSFNDISISFSLSLSLTLTLFFSSLTLIHLSAMLGHAWMVRAL